MKLLSVNVGKPQEVIYDNKKVLTGIFKQPLQGKVQLKTLNLAGDGQADLKVHGGIHKAVYIYSIENYDYWRAELGRDDFTLGQFGENFTVSGMTDDQVHIGDIFQVGTAQVEVTQPRRPCFKLGIRMAQPDFPHQFLASCRTGFYVRVVQEGEVEAGDSVQRLSIGPGSMTVQMVCDLLYGGHDKSEPSYQQAVQQVLQIPSLSPSWQRHFEQKIR
ncbi:MAG: MOSC domain-containing protein [Microcoleaceae cyanobacterium]